MKILSLDLGTSGCKLDLFDQMGKQLYSVSNKFNRVSSVALNPDFYMWKNAIYNCIRRASKVITVADSIVITGQSTVPVWLKKSGLPASPIISYLDPRLTIGFDELELALGDHGYVGTKLFSGMLWLKNNKPSSFRQIRLVMDVKEFLGYLLTGRATYDANEVSKKEINYMSSRLGLDDKVWGEPHDYKNPVGKLNSGLLGMDDVNDIPVYVMPMDSKCSLLGSGILTGPGFIADVAGTTEILGFTVEPGSMFTPNKPMIFDLPIYFTSPPLGLMYEWVKDNLSAKFNHVASSLHHKSKEVLMPSLGSEMAIIPDFRWERYGWKLSLNYIGMDIVLNEEQTLEAVFKAMAAEVALFVQATESNGKEINKIIASGNGSGDDAMVQLKANMTGKVIETAEVLDSTGLGAANIALVNAGIYKNLQAASIDTIRTRKRFKPRQIPYYLKYIDMYKKTKTSIVDIIKLKLGN